MADVNSPARPAGRRLLVVGTLLAAFVSLGFSIAGLIDPALVAPGAAPALVAPFASYAAARSIAIAVAVVVAIGQRSAVPLQTVGWIAAAVQATDALIGLTQHDPGKTIGPAVLAAFAGYALVRFGRARR